MKKPHFLFLILILLGTPTAYGASTAQVAEARIFGLGKPKYNKAKIQRQNTPDKINRRSKGIQRKNGIGMLPVTIWKEVSHG